MGEGEREEGREGEVMSAWAVKSEGGREEGTDGVVGSSAAWVIHTVQSHRTRTSKMTQLHK